MELLILDTGGIIMRMGKAGLYMQAVILMKAIGSEIEHMDMALIRAMKVALILEIGIMINSMGKVLRSGTMVQSSRVIM